MTIVTDPNQLETTKKVEEKPDDRIIIESVWSRFEYGKDRGHIDYCAQANKCDRFYLGGGGQWSAEDRKILEDAKRPVTEINEIMPAINTAVGYQINNRMDITYLPRGGEANEESAKTMSKVVKQVLDNNDYRWLETDIFEDGLILQRGYIDIRVGFDDSLLAEIIMSLLDPRDVQPDPDAKSSNPKKWADVCVSSWPTLDDIEQLYGLEKRIEVESFRPSDEDHGDGSVDEERPKFGDHNTGGTRYDSWKNADNVQTARVRVVDRQYWKYVECKCLLNMYGDIRVIEDLPPEKMKELVANGGSIITRKMRRVRWTVVTSDVVLFDDWSPFDQFTVIGYFPYFRRGKTRGMVDNAISPQETLNKGMAGVLGAVNQVTNSGWITWQDTLANMTPEQLKADGARPGLHIEVTTETPVDKIPQKILPNPMPAGLDRIVEHARTNLKAVTVNDEMSGKAGEDMSGIAIQSRQFAGQQSLARPLDNLARFRHLVGKFLVSLVQKFYDDPRIMRIRQQDKLTGKGYEEQLAINIPQDDGSITNDLTLGEYGLVVTETPINVTFENGAFQQAKDMKELGVNIPDVYLVKNSTLPDKSDIIESMQGAQAPDPLVEAKVALMKAQTDKTMAESTVRNVEAIFSATEAAQNIAALPQVAPLADDILGSSGYIDKDGAPLVPVIDQIPLDIPGQPPVPFPPKNTNPLTPRNPATGMNAGIEGGQDGEVQVQI